MGLGEEKRVCSLRGSDLMSVMREQRHVTVGEHVRMVNQFWCFENNIFA